MQADEIKQFQRELLCIEPDTVLRSDNVAFQPQMESWRMCAKTERYFQETMLAYHYDDVNPERRLGKPDRLGATAVVHDDAGIGVVKNYGHPLMLCTQTVRGEHDDYMSRGFIYSVNPDIADTTRQGYHAHRASSITYCKKRPVDDHNLCRHKPKTERIGSTPSLLDHADRFIEEMRSSTTADSA